MISNIIFYNKLPYKQFTYEKINDPTGTGTQDFPLRSKPFNHFAIGLNPSLVIIAKTRFSGFEVSHNTNILIYEYSFKSF